jgi:hypothetical protein
MLTIRMLAALRLEVDSLLPSSGPPVKKVDDGFIAVSKKKWNE